MPTHFNTLQEFRDLITKHSVAGVVVSQDDYIFLWERTQPIHRCEKKGTITVLNNRNESVSVRTNLRGILDLTTDNLVFTVDY